ncbi:DUF1761 domain-containing protein [Brevundimonas sp.]|uniref:DUF1761 domain-containing protein n=1 Tax=Brevundimonas sp. TaxID=1871086 RepID=UPI0025E3AE5F|nr:DUF1761 domain-containing protein [Brevundimonas sp.]
MFKGTNWIGVIVAGIVTWLIGALWYGMIFKDAWIAATGVDPDAAASSGMTPMILGFGIQLLIAVGMGWLVPRMADGWMGGLRTGLFSWVFLGMPVQAYGFVYMTEPMEVLPMDFGYVAVTFMLSGAIVGGLRFGPKSAPA